MIDPGFVTFSLGSRQRDMLCRAMLQMDPRFDGLRRTITDADLAAVAMPFTAAAAIGEFLVDRNTRFNGETRSKELARVATKTTSAVREYARHPAFSNIGAIGEHLHAVKPMWGSSWFPVQGEARRTLIPKVSKWKGSPYTVWSDIERGAHPSYMRPDFDLLESFVW